MELQLELEHARGSSEKEQPRENYRLPRDGNAQVRRLRRGVRHRPHAANPWICGLPKSKQGGSKKSWRKSTSAKGSTPTESNCRTESYLGIYRQRRLVRKVLFLFVPQLPALACTLCPLSPNWNRPCAASVRWTTRTERSAHIVRHRQLPNGFLTGLRAKRADPAFMEFAGQGQHLACVPAAYCPLKQGSVLVELNDIPQPLRAR